MDGEWVPAEPDDDDDSIIVNIGDVIQVNKQ